MSKQPMTQSRENSGGIARLGVRDMLTEAWLRKPEDLDAGESQRWEQHRAELDRAVKQGDAARTLHAVAMLERLRYGCH